MKEKIKKTAISLLYRSIICLCLFGIVFALSRFFPETREKIKSIFTQTIDLTVAGKTLCNFFKEILPFI